MARSRNIKPGFFDNTALAGMPPLARLLYVGLWTQCDREGRTEDDPQRLKARILPYDRCDVNKFLDLLAAGPGCSSFIIRYRHYENRYIQVRAWKKHQNPHVKEPASTIPAPDLSGSGLGQALPFPERALLIPDSLNLIPDSSPPEPSVSPFWLEAGFEGPEAFEVWWDRVVQEHPNRNRNTFAKNLLWPLVQTGQFRREEFEQGYAKMRAAAGEDWTKQNGRFCTNLYEIVENKLWRFDPVLSEPEQSDGLTPDMRRALEQA
jgi:hypothetical protein